MSKVSRNLIPKLLQPTPIFRCAQITRNNKFACNVRPLNMPRVLVCKDKKIPHGSQVMRPALTEQIFKAALQIFLSFSHCRQFLYINRNGYSGTYAYKNSILKYYIVLEQLLHNTVLIYFYVNHHYISSYMLLRTVFSLNSCLNQFSFL